MTSFKKNKHLLILLLLSSLMTIQLSCNLPVMQLGTKDVPTNTPEITKQFIATSTFQQTNRLPATTLPAPTTAPSSSSSQKESVIDSFSMNGIEKDKNLVFLQTDGTIIYQRADNTLNKVKTSISIKYNELQNLPEWKITFSAGKTVYPIERSDFSGLAFTDDSGVTEEIPSPRENDRLINALPSPDGSQIVWLFDETGFSEDELERCKEVSTCTGREYQLVLTDGDGTNARDLLHYSGGIDRTIPNLLLYKWKSDSKSIFLRWESTNPTAFYPSSGGGIVEVTVPGGTLKEWKLDWKTDSIINDDGNLLATANDYENGNALRLSNESGDIVILPLEADHLISQMIFSPSNKYLYWIDTGWNDAMVINSLVLKAMEIPGGEISTVTEFDLPQIAVESNDYDMPYPGNWLTENLLVINWRDGSHILNIRTGQWNTSLSFPETTKPIFLLNSVAARNPVDSHQLSKDGPWLVFRTENGFLWGVNEDGSGLTQLTHLPMVAPSDLSKAVSPDGKTLAYVSSTNPEKNANFTLNLLSLPEGSNEVITVLTSPESEPDASTWEEGSPSPVGNKSYEATRAITIGNSVAWSPNGRVIAFIGAQNGPSSDLFTYSLSDKSFQRLSSGPSQAYNPAWSPNGSHIVYFGASTFGSGAGYEMVGVWVSPADNVGSIELYDPSRTGNGENLVGWLDNDTFVVYSVSDCPGKDLRSVNINSGAIRMLYNDCFWQAALTPDGTLAIVNDSSLVEQPGLYILSPNRSDLFYISEGAGQAIRYIPEPGILLVQSRNTGPTIQSFAIDGSPADFQGIGDFPILSPDKSFWVWNETGGSEKLLLKNSQNEYIIPLTVSPGSYPIWNMSQASDDQKLFFFSNPQHETISKELYLASAPDFDKKLIMENLAPDSNAVWVSPR